VACVHGVQPMKSAYLISALFGFSHYQHGLTGIIEEGSDGLILGLMYLACRRNLVSLQNENVLFVQSRNVRFHGWPRGLWKRSGSP